MKQLRHSEHQMSKCKAGADVDRFFAARTACPGALAYTLVIELARRQWEYSHAAGAVLTFAALVAIVLAALLHKPRNEAGGTVQKPVAALTG